MDADTAQVTISPATVRGRLRRTALDLDGRSVTAKRVNKLIGLFVAELGGRDAVTATDMLKIRRAAELTVACEELRASTLSREHPPTDLAMLALTRLEGLADRAVRRLGLGLERKREQAAGLGALLVEDRAQGKPEDAA